MVDLRKLGIKCEAEWIFDKFKDPTGVVADALGKGAVMDAVKRHVNDGMWDGPRFIGREIASGLEFQSEEVAFGNLGLNEGLGELIDLIAGLGTPSAWNAANAYIGVGNSNTAAQATDTDLIGASKLYKAMDGSYPARAAQTMKHRSTFGTSDANWAWEEYTLSNTSSGTGKNLQRKVESKGTKASGETWTLEIQNTFS